MKNLKDSGKLKNITGNIKVLENQDLGKIKGGLIGVFIIGA